LHNVFTTVDNFLSGNSALGSQVQATQNKLKRKHPQTLHFIT
jgi:hypothetical protein